MTSPVHVDNEFEVKSSNVQFSSNYILSDYLYQNTKVDRTNSGISVRPVTTPYKFRTGRRVPKTGVMIVGLGGNNGSTVTGAILANKHNICWKTNRGVQKPNYWGSITQATTTFLGMDSDNRQVYVPLNSLLPMINPNELVVGGWDISGFSLDEAMQRAQVYPESLQKQLRPYMKDIRPLKSIFYPDFYASNQVDRADNIYPGLRASDKHIEIIRRDIREFKNKNKLDKVIVLWSANTERYSEVLKGVHDTEKNLMKGIHNGHPEIAPSQMFAVASILEGCSFINGSPQNTFAPAIISMAKRLRIFIAGDDFKSGQTKIKSALVDFLVSSGLKPESIVSYNHLGNNDGRNLAEYKQFRSKEISKSNVVDDMVSSNRILYAPKEKPDHCVVIKYVPHVGDSKRAMDEYISSIFMNGDNTIVLHNTCEDSLLAAPLIIDLVVLCELFQRIEWKTNGDEQWNGFGAVLTVLSFLTKAPLVPEDAPLVNALFKQRSCIENILRACIGLPPNHDMLLEYKTTKTLRSRL